MSNPLAKNILSFLVGCLATGSFVWVAIKPGLNGILVVSVTAFWGLVVWFVKLILLERYQFMDMIGGKPVQNPYVMIRLDRLTGAVDAFNWAGWVRIKPHSGYPGTEKPGASEG
jgi:hypothetical protein